MKCNFRFYAGTSIEFSFEIIKHAPIMVIDLQSQFFQCVTKDDTKNNTRNSNNNYKAGDGN